MRATGLDITEAMIGEAQRRVAEAPPEIRHRLRFIEQLLAEISLLFSKGLSWDELAKFVQAFKSALPGLEEALALDRGETSSTASAAAAPAFLKERRQHTPRDVARLAEAEGFRTVGFVGVHPHPLPPGLQVVAPRFYNQLATVFSELKTAPANQVWSSAFIGIFRL